jgi:hypothetical protein
VALSVGGDGCAAYWPAQAGWQLLHSGAAQLPFYVDAADDGAGLRAERDRQATLLLAQPEFPALAPAPPQPLPLPRWPFLLAWLALALAVWWMERANRGMSATA